MVKLYLIYFIFLPTLFYYTCGKETASANVELANVLIHFMFDLAVESANVTVAILITIFFCIDKEISIVWFYKIISFSVLGFTYLLQSLVLINRDTVHSFLMNYVTVNPDEHPNRLTTFIIIVVFGLIMLLECGFICWLSTKNLHGNQLEDAEDYIFCYFLYIGLITANVWLDNFYIESKTTGPYRSTITALTAVVALFITIKFALKKYWNLQPEIHNGSDDGHDDDPMVLEGSEAEQENDVAMYENNEEIPSISNSPENRTIEITSSSAIPFSSDPLKAPKTDLSLKASTTVGNVLAKTNDDKQMFVPVFGIKIKNAKVTAAKLTSYCTGFKKIRLIHLRKTNIPKGDWITMGIIVEKSEFIKTANGYDHIIWKLSDITSFQATPVKVLLFGDCVKQHYMLQQSSVIALKTPQFVNSTDHTITLKLTHSSQILNVGFSSDFGYCKALTKEGTKCTKCVNTSSTKYCAYHIQPAANTTLESSTQS